VSAPPFYFVPLDHPDWDGARACARALPPEAMPELRLDLFPDLDAETLVRDLGRRCLVSCRRREEGGAWAGTEAERLERLLQAVAGRPAWMDLEWDLDLPAVLGDALGHVRLLRSARVAPGVFDLERRLGDLPRGDAFAWIGHAARLDDNARLKGPLAWARDRGLRLSAFLAGPRGVAGRCLQAAWGGSFTWALADDAPAAEPGQLALGRMRSWRCHKLGAGYGLCGVLGLPVLHSRGPEYHNPRFQRAFKDLIYLPLECGDADEAVAALEGLDLLGASLTAPLKETVPPRLGLAAPLNTLYRRSPGTGWRGANTDRDAADAAFDTLAAGPVLVLGDGGVAATTRQALEHRGWPYLQASRRAPVTPEAVRAFAPVGVVQTTRLGMEPGDPAPFPELLEAAGAGARWAVEWIYKEDTAFAGWARDAGLRLVPGDGLFEAQAAAQSDLFVRECGG
jgi:3-dehydroquinate dehydratase/shikimate dehydrogenase